MDNTLHFDALKVIFHVILLSYKLMKSLCNNTQSLIVRICLWHLASSANKAMDDAIMRSVISLTKSVNCRGPKIEP